MIKDIKNENLTQRELASLNTRHLLLKSAMELFTKRGFENVTIDEITDLAGVSKGSFYNHFMSKESVFIEEFKKIDAYYDLKLNEVDENISNGEKILVVINAMTDYCSNICGIEFMRVVYSSQISTTKTVLILNNKERKLYRHIDNIIRNGIESGEFKISCSVETIVEWLIRSTRGLVYDWCLNNGKFDLEDEGEKYFKHIVSLLKGEISLC